MEQLNRALPIFVSDSWTRSCNFSADRGHCGKSYPVTPISISIQMCFLEKTSASLDWNPADNRSQCDLMYLRYNPIDKVPKSDHKTRGSKRHS